MSTRTRLATQPGTALQTRTSGTTARAPSSAVTSKKARTAGRILSGLTILFLLMDTAMKFTTIDAVVKGTEQLGWPLELTPKLGVLLFVLVVLYAVPRTSVLGALLLTGYLGGAVASHVRVGDPLFSHVLFPVYIGAMLWGGLLLRDRRLAAFFPLRRAEGHAAV